MYSVTDCREELDATPTTSSALRYNGLALKSQLRSERIQCGGCVLSIRALGLEPCEQKLQAQRVAVMVPALVAAVGCVLLWACAPPSLEAVFVDELGGAAAGAWLHERAVIFLLPPAQPAPLLCLLITRNSHPDTLTTKVWCN